MIVRPKPHFLGLFYVLRGSILPTVAPPVLGVAALSADVVLLQHRHPAWFASSSPAPFTLLGLALSIFLSFRNGACYDRWWEGRRQWGQLIVEMRAFSRLLTALFPGEAERPFRARLLRSAVGFAHALNARLRGEDEPAAAGPWATVTAGPNVPDAVLTSITVALAGRVRDGSLGEILFQTVEARVAAMSGIQTACERIRSTPLPFAYSLLLHRTAYLFCVGVPFGFAASLGWGTPVLAGVIAYTFFGLDALGTELEEPFGRAANDLPLDAMVRTIEIDLLPAAGEATPTPLRPTRFVLQ